MRINRLRLRAQQRAIQAMNKADDRAVQSAVSGLADAVAGLQAEVIAKTTGTPVDPPLVTPVSPAVKSAMHDLRENVADLQAEIIAPPGTVKVDPHMPLVTPDEARVLAAKLLADADAAEKKP